MQKDPQADKKIQENILLTHYLRIRYPNTKFEIILNYDENQESWWDAYIISNNNKIHYQICRAFDGLQDKLNEDEVKENGFTCTETPKYEGNNKKYKKLSEEARQENTVLNSGLNFLENSKKESQHIIEIIRKKCGKENYKDKNLTLLIFYNYNRNFNGIIISDSHEHEALKVIVLKEIDREKLKIFKEVVLVDSRGANVITSYYSNKFSIL